MQGAGAGYQRTVVISLALMLLTGLMMGHRVIGASDGSVVQMSNAPWNADRIKVNVVLDDATGLRDGDIVTGVDGDPLPRVKQRILRKGDYVRYSVLRRDAPTQEAITLHLADFPIVSFLRTSWPSLLTLLALLTIAAFVLHQRRTDPAAQALMLTAALTSCGTMGWLLGEPVFQLATAGPSGLDLGGELALALVWGATAHFALVAPGSTLTRTRRKVVAVYALPLVLHACYLAVTVPSASSRLQVAGLVTQVSLVPSTVLPAGTALIMTFSFRSMRDAESRERMRWVLATFAAGACAFLLLWTVPSVFNWKVPPESYIAMLFLPPILALGAAILRYRLFDIEVIVRRSLLYGTLTGCVLAAYLAGAWLLSRLPRVSPGLVAVLTGGLVALIAPTLRARLHRSVGRLIYGERDDPFEVMSRLGRVDAGGDPGHVLNEVAETLAQTLRLTSVSIRLRTPGSRFAIAGSYGHGEGKAVTLPLDSGAGVLGHLTLVLRPGQEPFGSADRRLLDTLIRQVSGAASTVLLTNELQQSREQIVMAREEERRRLHHRLHDGLGPNLVAAVMQLEVIKNLLRRDPHRASQLLDVQITTSRELIAEVRGLVFNLRPPALDQLGLTGALRERACYLAQPRPDGTAAMRIDVEELGLMDDLPAAVEVAAFWIGAEAVSNAVRHAGASTCLLRFVRGQDLCLQIQDDGRGLPERVTPSGGWISMRERAEELGGTCTVRRGDVRGTVVEAHLPIRDGKSTR